MQLGTAGTLFAFIVTAISVGFVAEDDSPRDVVQAVKAPPISPTFVMDVGHPGGLPLPDLTGKVVVLEFWATWCVPCVAAISHLNKIAADFDKKDVVFISVTPEDLETVKRFVVNRPIRGYIAIDPNRAVLDSYRVKSFPHTVVIDRKGQVVCVTDPAELSSEMLRDVLAEKDVACTPRSRSLPWSADRPPSGSAAASPIASVQIFPHRAGNVSISGTSTSKKAKGWSIQQIVAYAYDWPRSRIRLDHSKSNELYDVEVTTGESCVQGPQSVLRAVLEPVLGVRVSKIPREVDAYELRIRKGGMHRMVRAAVTGEASGVFDQEGHVQGFNLTMPATAMAMERILEIPIIDHTELGGRFDWEVSYDTSDRSTLIERITSALGLELVPAKHTIEFIEILDVGD